ncbi:MAG: hypothetical protein AAGK23_14540, partial [Pseudomonadota bacterium]
KAATMVKALTPRTFETAERDKADLVGDIEDLKARITASLLFLARTRRKRGRRKQGIVVALIILLPFVFSSDWFLQNVEIETVLPTIGIVTVLFAGMFRRPLDTGGVEQEFHYLLNELDQLFSRVCSGAPIVSTNADFKALVKATTQLQRLAGIRPTASVYSDMYLEALGDIRLGSDAAGRRGAMHGRLIR